MNGRLALGTLLLAFATCAGCHSESNTVTNPDVPQAEGGTDGGRPDGAASEDSSTGSSGSSGSSGSTVVACTATPPKVFAPTAGAGPFCLGVGTYSPNHCKVAQQCCHNLDTGTRACAASCASGVAATGCYSAGECPPGTVCCATGTVDTAGCAYPTLGSFTQSVCSAACSKGEHVACSSNAECAGGACTPTYVLNTASTTTTDMQIGLCL
jgi:hypothetical protein